MPDRSDGFELRVGHEDVFGVPTRNVLSNVLDIASHYPINPERLRLKVNGSRKFPQYNSVSQYNHAGPHHELKPNQDDTVILESAERPRYVVGLEQVMSFAAGLSRSLESGDTIRAGLYDDNDGWFLEHRGDHADDQTCDFVVRTGGSDTKEKTDISIDSSFTTFHRKELHTAWYRISRQLWRETYVDDNRQRTDWMATTYQEDGPEKANLPLRFEVTRGSSSSDLTLECGSLSLLTKGARVDIRRFKTHEISVTTDSSAGDAANSDTFFPQYAFRIDPGRNIVNMQVTGLKVMKYGGTGDVRVAIQAHDETKVHESDGTELDDADFSTPPTHSSQNSVFEETTAVTDAADSTGTITSSADDLGGYQIGYASLYDSSQGTSAGKTQGGRLRKRALYGGDIGVMWVRADDSDVELIVEIDTEQDW